MSRPHSAESADAIVGRGEATGEAITADGPMHVISQRTMGGSR
jgi:hypothetical protein